MEWDALRSALRNGLSSGALKIGCYGDSCTEGFNPRAREVDRVRNSGQATLARPWPSVLQDSLGSVLERFGLTATVDNFGYWGDTTKHTFERWSEPGFTANGSPAAPAQAVAKAIAGGHVAIVSTGYNDCFWGSSLEDTATFSRRIIERERGKGCEPLIALEPTPDRSDAELWAPFRRCVLEAARQHQVAVFDLQDALGSLRGHTLDGTHYTPLAHERIGESLAAYVASMLAARVLSASPGAVLKRRAQLVPLPVFSAGRESRPPIVDLLEQPWDGDLVLPCSIEQDVVPVFHLARGAAITGHSLDRGWRILRPPMSQTSARGDEFRRVTFEPVQSTPAIHDVDEADRRAAAAALPGAIAPAAAVGLADFCASGWFDDANGRLAPGFPVTADDRVLDLGCGEGGAGEFCLRRGAHVCFADLSSEKIATLAARHVGDDRVQSIVTASDPLPLADAGLSRVVCMEVLEHVADPRQVMRELVRVGRDECLYLLAVPAFANESIVSEIGVPGYFEHPNHIRVFTREAFEELVSDSGLLIERYDVFGFFHALASSLMWLTDKDLSSAWSHPLLVSWADTWAMVIGHPQGASIKRALDHALPKSQYIVARKVRG